MQSDPYHIPGNILKCSRTAQPHGVSQLGPQLLGQAGNALSTAAIHRRNVGAGNQHGVCAQRQRLAAFAALREQQLHLGIASVFPLVLRFAVLESGCAVGMDAAAQLFVAILPVQALRDAVAHVPVKFRAQLGDGQQTLVIARRAFQNDGRAKAVLLKTFQAVAGHVIKEDMMSVP